MPRLENDREKHFRSRFRRRPCLVKFFNSLSFPPFLYDHFPPLAGGEYSLEPTYSTSMIDAATTRQFVVIAVEF